MLRGSAKVTCVLFELPCCQQVILELHNIECSYFSILYDLSVLTMYIYHDFVCTTELVSLHTLDSGL